MPVDLGLLVLTAASIGVVHTALGPDHYLPFVAMGAARRWSTRRTLWITALCGLGHVLGSVVLGAAGLAIGASLTRLEWLEGLRGNAAAWLLVGFGVAYGAWGLKHALRGQAHAHRHRHPDGTVHDHQHAHEDEHLHMHGAALGVTPWALFVVFILGPCEPLIPLLMYPAAQFGIAGTATVAVAFAITTIATMLTIVLFARRGLAWLPAGAAARWSHALAGAAVGLCGLAIVFLGL